MRFTLFGVILLLYFAFDVRAKESIFSFEYGNTSFGEAYHVVIGFHSNPDAYIYLHELSGIPDLPAHRASLVAEVDAIKEVLASEKIFKNDIQKLKDEITVLRRRIDTHDLSVKLAAYFRDAGYGDRIIDRKIALTGGGRILVDLKGAPLPEPRRGAFKDPTQFRLHQTTEDFLTLAEQNPDGATSVSRGLRKALLGGSEKVDPEIDRFIREKIAPALKGNPSAVVLWNRQMNTKSRNMSESLFLSLYEHYSAQGKPILIMGSEIPKEWEKARALMASTPSIDLTGLWKNPPFNSPETTIKNQLGFLAELHRTNLISQQVGMISGAIDGPALIGIPTIAIRQTVDHEPTSFRIDKLYQKLGPQAQLVDVDQTSPAGSSLIRGALVKACVGLSFVTSTKSH